MLGLHTGVCRALVVRILIQTVFTMKNPALSCFFGGDEGSCSLLIFVQRAALSQDLLSATAMYNTTCPIDLGSHNLGKLCLGGHVLIQKHEWTVLSTALVKSYNNILSRNLTTNEPEQLHQMQLRLSSQIRAVLQKVTSSQNTQWAYKPSREDVVLPRICMKSYYKLHVKMSTGQGGRDKIPSKGQVPNMEVQKAWSIHDGSHCCPEWTLWVGTKHSRWQKDIFHG